LVQETIVTNVGEDDKSSLASEATLLDLLDAMEKMAKASGADPAAARAKTEKLLLETKKSSITAVRKFTEELEKTSEIFKKVTKTFNGLYSLTAGLIGVFAGVGTNFADALMNGSDQLTDFAKHVPLVGNQLAIFTSFIDSTIETFRNLSDAGINFSESLLEIRSVAADARLNLDTFSRAVQTNSSFLALMSGSANEGARRFGEISGILNRELRPSLMNLGFNTEELADYTASYLVQQTLMGRAQRLNSQQLASGTGEYLMQLDRLARITGRSRQELSRQLEDQLRDRRIVALTRSMDQEAFAEMNRVIAGIEDTDMQEAIREMVSTGGVPLSEMGRGLISVMPELSDASRRLRDGQISAEEFAEVLQRNASVADDFMEENGYTAAALAALGNDVYALVPILARMGNFGILSAEATEEQRLAMERREGALVSFSDSLINLRSQFFEAIEPLLQPMVEGFSSIIGYLTRSDVIESFITAVGRAVDFLLGSVVEVVEPGTGDVHVERMGGFIDRMMAGIDEQGIGQYLLTLMGSLGSVLMTEAIDSITGWWSEQSLFTQTMIGGAIALFALSGPLSMALAAGIGRLFSGASLPGAASGAQGASGARGSSLPGAASGARGATPLSIPVWARNLAGRLAMPAAIGAIGYEFFKLYQRGPASDELMQELQDSGHFEDPTNYMNADMYSPPVAEEAETENERLRRNLTSELSGIFDTIATSGIETDYHRSRMQEIEQQLQDISGTISDMSDVGDSMGLFANFVRRGNDQLQQQIDQAGLQLTDYNSDMALIEREQQLARMRQNDLDRQEVNRLLEETVRSVNEPSDTSPVLGMSSQLRELIEAQLAQVRATNEQTRILAEQSALLDQIRRKRGMIGDLSQDGITVFRDGR
jgi:hypothetical protein